MGMRGVRHYAQVEFEHIRECAEGPCAEVGRPLCQLARDSQPGVRLVWDMIACVRTYVWR
jgi:hypothetical protein